MAEKANILIVEDNEVLAEFIGDELRDNGYDTAAVSTGSQAVNKMKTNVFDVALLDIKLPDMKGTEVLVKLKEINPDIVCIMITGNATLETTIDSLRGGAEDFIIKPLDLTRLLEIVNRAVKKLRKLQTQLMNSARLEALGKMAAVVAHEIRNPIASIRAAAQRISQQLSGDDPGNKYTRYIMEESDRLGGVVRNILVFSKEPSPQFAPNDMNKLIEDVLDFLDTEISAPGIKVIKSFAPALPSIPFDSSLVRQVLINILQNALHFMADSKIKELKVSTLMEGNKVVVKISDTGPGIPKENMKKIFEPFFSTKPSGTGLGLAISRKIIRSHRGEIQVDNESARGTTFNIIFPI